MRIPRTPRKTWPAALALAAAAALGSGLALATAGPAAAAGAAFPAHFAAPYLQISSSDAGDMAADEAATGLKYYTLAFLIPQSGCTPEWEDDGSGVGAFASQISAIQSGGGNVIISFGGEAGTELAESCSSVTTLEAAYQKVVDTYGVYDLDFDIEGAAESDTASIAMRSDALALLQRDEAVLGHQVEVSLTLPVLPSGFPGPEMAVVRSAVAAGVHVSIFNAMTMDYGGAVATPAQMGTYAIDAARAVHQQLASVFPGFRSSQLWGMVGITPMIGQNDVTDEVFTLSDAVQVATFAAQQGIGRLSMWSVSRDQQCAQGIIDYDSNICSGVLQSGWAFSHVLQSGEASPG